MQTRAPAEQGTFGRLTRALMSLAGLVALLAGMPAALIAFVGWPLPRTWPTGEQWLAWAQQPVTVPFLVGLFTCAGWLLWAAITAAVVAEIAATVLRVDTSRWHLPTPLRAAAAGLVGAVLLAVVGSAARAAAPTAAPAALGAQPAGANTSAPALGAAQSAVAPPTALTTTKKHHGRIAFTVRGQRYHAIVRRGDTMSKIAKQWLGDADRWPEICRLNWHRHWPATGGNLRDCDLIHPRWDLRLPSDATPPPGAARVGQTPQTPRPATQQPTPTTPTPAEPAPAATPIRPDPDGVVDTTPAPTATTRTDEGTDLPTAAPAPSSGVTLPDGWVPGVLAAAILAAATAAWAWRRRSHHPRPVSDLGDTPTWQATPATIIRLRSALRPGDDDTDRPHDTEPPAVPAARTEPAPADQPPETGLELTGIGPLPANGLVMAGAGAHAAARALIVATLTTPPPHHGRIITTTAVVQTLLGEHDLQHDRLTVVPAAADAVDEVIRLTLARTRREQQGTGITLPDDPADAPTTILLLDDTSGHDRIIDAIIPVAAACHIGVVYLRPRPGILTLDIDHAGNTDRGPRAAVLNTDAALDILAATTPSVAAPPHTRPAAARTAQPATTGNTAHPARTQVKILGRPQILDRYGNPVTGLRSAAVQTLVLLAAHRTKIAKIDLWEALFPDATMQRAEERFAVTIADLRNGFRRAADDKTINAVPNLGGSYQLDPDLVDVDLWQFNDHLAEAARTTDPHTRRRHLHEALATHTGQLAEGTAYDWIEPHEHALNSSIIDVLVALADTADDPRTAAEQLDRASAMSPANTELCHRTLRAWAAVHDHDRLHAALRRYRVSWDELAGQTDRVTDELAAALLAGRPVASWPQDPGHRSTARRG